MGIHTQSEGRLLEKYGRFLSDACMRMPAADLTLQMDLVGLDPTANLQHVQHEAETQPLGECQGTTYADITGLQ